MGGQETRGRGENPALADSVGGAQRNAQQKSIAANEGEHKRGRCPGALVLYPVERGGQGHLSSLWWETPSWESGLVLNSQRLFTERKHSGWCPVSHE